MSVTECRIEVQSSLLVAITYSASAWLEVELRGGARYRYFAVPPSVVDGLLAAHSKGAYFNRLVRPRFPFERLA
jgi:hypothetical protein